MNGNKLIQILSTLNKEEWIAYRKYLLMHTSEDSDNYRVFAYLQKRKDKLDDLPELEEIRPKHFNGLSPKSILNIFSRLYLWLEECLIHQSILKDERESQLRLVKLYNRRGLYNLADQKARKLSKLLDSDESLSIDKLWARSQMKYYQYFSDNPIKNKENVLGQLANSLLEAHSAQKLLVYNELTNIHRRTKAYKNEINLYDPYINCVPDTNTNQFLLSLQELIKNDSVDHFYLLKDALLKKTFEKESDLEVLICMYLFAWVFDLVAQLKIDETMSTIEIVNYGLKNQLLTAGGQISGPRFMNLVNALSSANSLNEVNLFIDQWSKFVSSEDTESIKILSMAICYLRKNRYEEIPMQPTLLYFKDIHLKLGSISIYLITCFNYKSENYGILFDTISILKRTLARYKRELTKEYYQSYLNFTKVTQLIVERKPFILKDYSPIMHKPWIANQIDITRKRWNI